MIGRPDLDFKLSITRALADQLDESLERCVPAPLVEPEIARIERRPGVYELVVDGALVYIGKASGNLAARLTRHSKKLSGREGFEASDVRFVCLYVDEDLEASAPEKLLIKRHRARGSAPWNTNGFGNNDPGRRRDTSAVEANHFDAQHPINLDYLLRLPPGRRPVEDFLKQLKPQLPYVLRFAKNDEALAAYRAAAADVPDRVMTAREALRLAVAALPEKWQATALYGYAILYPENPTPYESATLYMRSTGTGAVDEVEGPRRLAPEGPVAAVDGDSDDDDDDGDDDDDDDDDYDNTSTGDP